MEKEASPQGENKLVRTTRVGGKPSVITPLYTPAPDSMMANPVAEAKTWVDRMKEESKTKSDKSR